MELAIVSGGGGGAVARKRWTDAGTVCARLMNHHACVVLHYQSHQIGSYSRPSISNKAFVIFGAALISTWLVPIQVS